MHFCTTPEVTSFAWGRAPFELFSNKNALHPVLPHWLQSFGLTSDPL